MYSSHNKTEERDHINKSLDDDDLAQNPQHQGHLKDEERLKQSSVQYKPKHGYPTLVVLQVVDCQIWGITL